MREPSPFWKFLGGLAVLAALLLVGTPPRSDAESPETASPAVERARSAVNAPGARWTTADHSTFEALKKDFTSPEEVTAACLSCHTNAATQLHHTLHWTWVVDFNGKKMGKYGRTLNNFCISVPTNEPRCTSCHIGYGWKNKDFDFSSQTKVDCLVCHDTTHTYEKFPTKAGYPATKPTLFPENGKTYLPPDYRKIVAKVGLPGRKNCGACHFYGGGGNGVKHGDLDSSMAMPNKALDVHMDAAGLNFTCQRCHTTKNHFIAGRLYASPASAGPISLTEADLASKITCESCHGLKPHKHDAKMNDHTDRVACQSCHIPKFARVLPTKMSWDWSAAGKRNAEGKPFKTMGPYDRPTYDSKKGAFVWEKNVVPTYYWFNGTMKNVMVTDKIDPTTIVSVNHPVGSPDDPHSRIMPFKRHTGSQPYDKVNKTLVFPHLFGPDDPTAFWTGLNWKPAVAAGMAYVNLPFSGEVGFVKTEYFFPTTHMVAPKEQALTCRECHAVNGRLKGLPGVYLPGRDVHAGISTVGTLAVAAALLAVLIHGLTRIIAAYRRR